MKNVRDWVMKLAEAASGGQLFLKAYPATYASDASVVTAMADNAYQVTVKYRLEDADGNVHRWFNHAGGIVTLTPAEVIVDADIAAPTCSDTTPAFIEGEATVVLSYDADAGATKDYAAGDVVTLTAGAMSVMGQTVDVSEGVFTDTFVA